MTNITRLQKLRIALALTAAVTLAACSTTSPTTSSTPSGSPETTSSASPETTPSTSPKATSSASPSQSTGRRIEISVKGKQVTPAPATINIAGGESLTVAVTSDKDNTLHAHGFEVAKELKAGQRGEVTVTGAQTGTFEFELHDPELLLFRLAVR